MLATFFKKPLWQFFKKPLWQFLKQPLLHFLVLGALIFVVYGFNAEQAAEPASVLPDKRIVVDRAALLNYLQYQAQAFEPEVFEARLAAFSASERDALVADFVREEALYREALQLGMEQGDYIIRQRLVQKVGFLLENLVAENIQPGDAELQAFYTARIDDYRVAAVYTFTHIFFNGEQERMDLARERAGALLATSAGIAFDQSAQHGDRYPFLQNYVERTRDFVANNFSAEFVAGLDALTPGEQWQGPLLSRYGWHLVMLRARAEPFTPPFEDIKTRVLDDYRYEELVRKRQEAEDRVVSEYDVVLNLE